MIDTDKLIVSIDFRDMKYLSNSIQTQQVVTDPEVIAGLKEHSIELDFSKLAASDASGQSRYINGGRVYFEANIFGYHTSSFTTKGFFDQQGYVEPMAKDSGVRWFLNNYATRSNLGLLGALAGLLLLLLFCCPSRSKLHAD